MNIRHLTSLVRSALMACSLLAIAPALLAANQEAPVQSSLLANPEAQEQAARVSRRDASDLAREVFHGRVLSIRLDSGKWRVRMDQEGTVFNVMVDANTGEVSRSEE